MSNQELDVEAARKLVDDLSRQLADAEKNGPKLAELRAEVETLRDMSTVSRYRGNPAAMSFVDGKQAQAGCDFGF